MRVVQAKRRFRRGGTLDQIDQLLLSELRRNARAPIVGLARAIGLSRSATQARIKRLIDLGMISGFTIVESAKAAQTAHFSVKLKAGFKCIQIVPKLKTLAGVIRIHSVTGASDILIQCEAADMQGIELVRTSIVEISGVEAVTTMIVLARHLN